MLAVRWIHDNLDIAYKSMRSSLYNADAKKMKTKDLSTILRGVKNAKRIYRDAAAETILLHPELIPELIDKIFDIEDPLHIKAAWVFEIICLEDISLLDPHISDFIRGMPLIKHESALRPVSKICSLWNTYFYSGKSTVKNLTSAERETIISCNFDWLIGNHKVATQVFAMDSLKLYGSEDEWILFELKSVLEKNAAAGSSGYRSHARKILKNL